MNPDLPPTPPNDTTPDPLLAALRQRLGDYGQAPPPAAWAAIRRRVAPPPTPWWRRPRRLLPLLALLVGLLLPGVLAERHGQYGNTHSRVAPLRNSLEILDSRASSAADASAAHSAAASAERASTATVGTTPKPAITSATLPKTASATSIAANRQGKPALKSSSTIGFSSTSARPSGAASARRLPLTPALAGAGGHSRRKATYAAAPQGDAPNSATATLREDSRHEGVRLAKVRSYQNTYRGASRQLITTNQTFINTQPAKSALASSQLAASENTHNRTATSQAKRRLAGTGRSAAAHSGHQLGLLVAHSAYRPNSRTGQGSRGKGAPGAGSDVFADSAAAQATLPPLLPSFSERGTAFDLLAFRLAGLVLPMPGLLPTLVARPDSTPPPRPVRRWALLVLAGPTLSYRTLGPAPALAAHHPDFARLERPALGMGAQVQVRRVLSGRWALAAGLGYHEYATRLALSVKDSNTYTTVRQRDTYRLLTVPVQVTYALGAPHGRLAVGLLLGTELGWYIGGRSTEGSDCGCKQQVYPAADSAQTSPYRPLSLAFSLGLDLRYRLGGPASRWQWVVQPTGRYVATPFVRSDAVGFTRRQPWSLGLLTGLSWDIR